MSMTVSVRIERKKSRAAVNGQKRHDERIGKQPKYIDDTRTHLNSVLLTQGSYNELKDACEELRKKGGKVRNMRANSVVAWSGIITFGIEAQPIIDNLERDEQNKLFKEAVIAVTRKLKTTATSCAVHRDESAIHCHFSLLAINESGESLSKTTNRDIYSQLQDEVGKIYNHLGITRGEKKSEKIERLKIEGETWQQIDAATVNRSVRELHEQLPAELHQLRERLIEIDAERLMTQSRLQKAQEKLDKVQKDTQAKEGALETLTKRVENYEKQLAKKEAEIKAINSELERKQHLVERVFKLEQDDLNDALEEGRKHGMNL